MLLALLLQAAPAPAAPPRDIVVTGRPLDATARALAECLARRCPPDADATATLAHAENQFVAGDYGAARQTLNASINRNRRFAKDYPEPVSNLMRANARVNAHMGEAELARINHVESLNALRAALPRTDARVLVQRMEVASGEAKRGRAEAALRMYAEIADDAGAAKLPVVEGYARLRRVVVLAAVSAIDSGYESDFRAAVRWFADRSDLQSFKTAAELVAAQMASRKGDPAAIDALIARYGRSSTRPQLIYAPVEVPQDADRSQLGGTATNALSVDDYAGQWADVSFWIKPDGRVGDLEILRGGPGLNEAWVKPITSRIAQRRYAPLAMAADEPGVLRVERYTRISDLVSNTRSRIRERGMVAHVEMIDLTADPAKPAS